MERNRSRHWSLVAFILAGLMGATILTPAPASAAPVAFASAIKGAGPETLTVVSSRAALTVNGVVTPAVTIVCTLTALYPHKSSHVPGTVNSQAQIVCTAPVAALGLTMGLIRDGTPVPGAPVSNFNAGQMSLRNNFATPCVTGTYINAATGAVQFPPGFVPPAGTMIHSSPPIPITC
jgi:hypothetical protein